MTFATAIDLLHAADKFPKFGRRAARTSNFGLPYGLEPPRGQFSMQQVVHVDPNVEKGKAIHDPNGAIYMHPDDYAELKKQIQGQQNLSISMSSTVFP